MKKVVLIVTGIIVAVLLIFGGLQWIGSQSNHSSATNTAAQTNQ